MGIGVADAVGVGEAEGVGDGKFGGWRWGARHQVHRVNFVDPPSTAGPLAVRGQAETQDHLLVRCCQRHIEVNGDIAARVTRPRRPSRKWTQGICCNRSVVAVPSEDAPGRQQVGKGSAVN